MDNKAFSLAAVATLTPGFAFKSKEFGSGFARAIKIGNISREISFCDLPIVDTSNYDIDKLKKYECSRGDFLVAMTGNTIGKVGRMVTGTAYANQRVLKISATDKIESGFLWAVLCTADFHSHVLSHIDSHSAQPNISAKSIGEYEVKLPNLTVQKRIASVFMSIEKKIELNKRTNDYLATLVDLEFSKRFSSSVSTTSLKNVLEISTKSLKPQQHAGETWEHYSIPAFDEMHWPIFELADGIKSNKYMVDRNSILISKLNPSIKRMWIPVCLTDKAVCSTEFIVYKPLEPRHKSFYCAAINANNFTAFLLEHVTGSTGSRQRVQPKATLDYPIPNPCRTAIETFCDFADPIYRQIEINEIESRRLGSLRDAFLPKLMSGEIDVSKVDLTQPNNHLCDF